MNETELFRPPGYPAFIALVYGTLSVLPGNLALVQLGLGGVVALLIFDGIARLRSANAGLIAAILYLADPFSAVWALPVLSDTLFSTLLMVVIYAMLRWKLADRGSWLLLAGIAGGVGSLVRPIGMLSLPLWGGFVLLGQNRAQDSGLQRVNRKGLKNSFVFGLAFIGVVVPWSLRNLLLWDTFAVSSVAQYNLEFYLAPSAIAEQRALSLDQARAQLNAPAGLTGIDRTLWYMRVILGNFPPYAKAHFRGIVHTALGLEYARWFTYAGKYAERLDVDAALRSEGVLAAIMLVVRSFVEQPVITIAYIGSLGYQLLLYIAGGVGFVHLYRRARWTSLLLLTTGLALVLTPGPVGEARFRVPVQPMLAMLAAVPLEALFFGRQESYDRRGSRPSA